MRNNYNIKLNPRQLSREDIEKHMDFDALLSRYKELPTVVQPRLRPVRLLMYTGGAIAAAVVGLLFYFGVLQTPGDRPAMTSGEYFAQQELVNPPLENIPPGFTSRTVNAEEGGAYDFEGGSRLVIPSQAFMDDRGRLIEGEVDIHYREMYDFVDFFLAGVPMTYDSAGQSHYMEPAGMIEIFALREGRRVRLAPGKTIEVELVSEITVPDASMVPRYNIYWLDTVQRKWVPENVEHVQLVEDEESTTGGNLSPEEKEKALADKLREVEARAAAEIAALEKEFPLPPAPVRPPRRERGKASFENELITNAAREIDPLTIPEGTVWQVSPRSSNFDVAELGKNWEDFRIRQLSSIEYELTFINPDREVKVIILPVLSGDQYDRAMRRYENDYASYQQSQVEREARIAGHRQLIEEAAEREKEAAKKEFERSMDSSAAAEDPMAANGRRFRIINRFQATKLGIWNCDRPLPADGEELFAGFVDQHGNEYNNHTVYLVNPDRNTIFRFYSGDRTKVKLDSQSLLWIVADDNRIAVLRSPDISRKTSGRKRQTVVLRLVDQEISSEADVREILRSE